MGFKEQVAADIGQVFFNQEEFAEIHTIDSKEILVVVDNAELISRQTKASQPGLYEGSLMIYVKAEDYGARPAIGKRLRFDGKLYIITNFLDEDGVYMITLEANRS